MTLSELIWRLMITASMFLTGYTNIKRGMQKNKEDDIRFYSHLMMSIISFSIAIFNWLIALINGFELGGIKHIVINCIIYFFIGLGCLFLYFCYIVGKSEKTLIFLEVLALTFLCFIISYQVNQFN